MVHMNTEELKFLNDTCFIVMEEVKKYQSGIKPSKVIPILINHNKDIQKGDISRAIVHLVDIGKLIYTIDNHLVINQQ